MEGNSRKNREKLAEVSSLSEGANRFGDESSGVSTDRAEMTQSAASGSVVPMETRGRRDACHSGGLGNRVTSRDFPIIASVPRPVAAFLQLTCLSHFSLSPSRPSSPR